MNDNNLMPNMTKNKVNSSINAQLDIIDEFRGSVESGDITDFMIIGLDKTHQPYANFYCNDVIIGLGMLEAGKLNLLNKLGENNE